MFSKKSIPNLSVTKIIERIKDYCKREGSITKILLTAVAVLIIIAVIISLMLKKDNEKIDITIDDYNFVAGVFELKGNYKKSDYLGKTVSIEGRYSELIPEGSDKIHHNVYRMAISSQSDKNSNENARLCKMEFVWQGDYPKDGDWIKVIGVLRDYEESGQEYIMIDAISVETMDIPGSLYVYY